MVAGDNTSHSAGVEALRLLVLRNVSVVHTCDKGEQLCTMIRHIVSYSCIWDNIQEAGEKLHEYRS